MIRSALRFAAASIAVALAIAVPATVVDAQSCVPAPSGIVSWYTMDGSTSDRQMANTPSATNAVSFVAGKVGQGVTFGSGGYIDIPDSASLALQRITLDAWARPDGPGPNNDAAGSILVGKNLNTNDVSVQIAWSAQSGGRFRFNFPGNSIVSGSAFPAGAFYHVAATYDGSTFRLYVNGALEGSFSAVQTIPYSSLPWDIGANTPGARGIGFPRTWNGVIDEVEILNRALSASEIAGIYAAGAVGKCKAFTCVPAPSGVIAWWAGDGNAADRADGNGGTLQNGAGFTTGLVGQAFSFDGVDDGVSFVNRPVADLFGSQFTIEYWANPGATVDRPTWGYVGSSIFNTNDPIASYDSWLTFGNGSGETNGVGYQLMTALPNAAANGWTHYAIVADGTNTYRVYVNGTQVNSAAITVRPASAGNRTFALGHSGFSCCENYYKGALDEFTLYNRGLAPSEIQSIVDAGLAGKCKNTCGNGILEPGEQCDDGNTVNGDCCSSTCQVSNVGSACTDGDACTYGDTCNTSGVCTGTSITCAPDQCNTRACNATSSCTVTPLTGAACNDGNACTYGDTCNGGGVCVGTSITCASDQCNTRACNGTSSCTVTPLSGIPCDDGSDCTSGETCQNGACGNPTSGVTCTALDQCHEVGTCNPATGVCSDPPKLNGAPCTDGNACTSGETCQNGTCGSPTSTVSCSPPDQCHDPGTCNPSTGACSNPAKPDGTLCTDGNACTSGETCQSGSCGSPTSTVTCSPPDQCHNPRICNPSTGVCSNPTKPDGTACNDGNACTSGETCQSGSCGSPTSTINCSTQDQCHDPGTCNPSTGTCSNPSKPNGAGCDDGNACTSGETCQGGSCGSPTSTVTCTALDQCHVAGTCDTSTGTCSNPSKPDGAACTDNDACTRSDTCRTGTCVGASPVICTAQDQCHEAGVCNSATGMCSNPAKPDGVGCNDANACTRVDVCQNGTCVGTEPVTCTALDQCHIAGTCNPATGACSDLIKPNGTDCDDGSACTTSDTCQAGICTGGSPPSCDDGNPCTTDSCTASTGCTHINNTAPCNDNDACTTNDHCSGGSCVGGPPPSCDDGNVCTDDGCNAGTGCTHTNNTRPCTDGLFCNGPDHCSGGTCSAHAGDPCAGGAECNDTCSETARNCLTPAGTGCTDDGNVCTDDQCDGAGNCLHPDNSAACDDMNPCTLDDICQGGSCSGTPKACDDGQFCDGVEECDFATGNCVNVPGSAPTCHDGMVCTTDRCDATANDNTGACANALIASCCTSDAQCDDGLACNGHETCDTRTGLCHDGVPVVCDDGDVCTTDTCSEPSGMCAFPAVAGCCKIDADCDDGSACTADTCDTAQHVCHHTDLCNDGRFCNGVETCNPAGSACIAGTPPDCSDASVCTTDTCDDALGQCTHTPVAGCCRADADCDDGDVCTTDSCATATGICHYASVSGCCNADGDCDDSNPCTTDRCDAGSHTCGHGPVDCHDGAVCTTDFCDAGAGCRHVNVPNCCVNDSDCDDHDVCDGRESCVNNQCTGGTAADCDDQNPCTDDSCDPQAGCLHVNNGSACDDGDSCTINDACSGGECHGGLALTCDDGNPCTTDSCNPATGCVHTDNTTPCSDGNACTTNDHCSGGQCIGGPAPTCDDGNPCTTDSCNPPTGCVHTNNANPCNDGNACTTNDTCSGGYCVGGAALNCDDHNVCTTDSCNPATGCAHTNNTNPCDDGDACTTGDACTGGVCAGTGDTQGPITTSVTVNPNPVQDNATVTLTATVSDATTGGSNVASVRYTADGICPAGFCSLNASDASFNSPTENVTATVGPLAAGVYDVCVRGRDSCGREGPATCVLLAVYNPNGGFVTGGGWITSPAGAYHANPQLTGRANFGFVSQYKKGATVPTGKTEFQFALASLNFHSASYDWLTVSGARAQYKGTGTINGAGTYGFMLTAIDGDVTGGGGKDKFRIKIWDESDADTVVYDNQLPLGTCTDTSDTATPCTSIAGGSIVIHK